jgi:hypothetical protein
MRLHYVCGLTYRFPLAEQGIYLYYLLKCLICSRGGIRIGIVRRRDSRLLGTTTDRMKPPALLVEGSWS